MSDILSLTDKLEMIVMSEDKSLCAEIENKIETARNAKMDIKRLQQKQSEIKLDTSEGKKKNA